MTIAPTIQYFDGIALWNFNLSKPETYIISNICLLVSNIIILIFSQRSKEYIFLYKKSLVNIINILSGKLNYHRSDPRYLLLVSIFGYILWILFYGIPSLDSYLYRNPSEVKRGFLESYLSTPAFSLIFETIRYIPFTSFIVYKLYCKNSILCSGLFLLLIFLSCPPTAMSRSISGTILFTIFIITFPKILINNRLHIFIIFGFLFVLPFLDGFRFFMSDVNPFTHMNINYLKGENYDSYSTLLWAIEAGSVTYGYQILGVLLFFLPRVIWESKPIGSGALTTLNADGIGLNISFNFYAESFINFWYFGFIIFPFCILILIKNLDNKILNFTIHENKSISVSISLIMIIYIFFILRGDLMSSFSYLMGLFIAMLISQTILNFSNKLKI